MQKTQWLLLHSSHMGEWVEDKTKRSSIKTKGFLCFNDSLWCILRCVCVCVAFFCLCVCVHVCVTVLCSSGGFSTPHLNQEWPIKLLVLLHAPPRFWGYMSIPSHPVCGVLKTSCMLSKQSISWATSSVYTIWNWVPLFEHFMCIPKWKYVEFFFIISLLFKMGRSFCGEHINNEVL